MTKKSLFKILAAFFIGFLLAGGLSNQADAKVGFTYVYNGTSKVTKIACNYDGPLIELKPGRNSMDFGKCTKKRSDTDQIYTSTTIIIHFAGPKRKDGCYRVMPGKRAKIPDLSVVNERDLKDGCQGKDKYYGYWNYF